MKQVWCGILVLLCGCAVNRGALIEGGGEVGARVPGLYPCSASGRELVELDPGRPLTVIVPGIGSSGARFEALAQALESHGQQTLCFEYNDRDFLNTSATQLAAALGSLQRRLEPQEITVLGHSQGGLVARRALQADLPRPLLTREGFTYRLVTVASPFSGVRASRFCGMTWMHVVTLSVSVGVCLAITGNKWSEIVPGSRFLNNPAPLISAGHLQIVTDERASCRTRDPDGRCREDDFVFHLAEQASPVPSVNATAVTVRSGHTAIVGEGGAMPLTLIEVLEREGVLSPPPLSAKLGARP